MTKKEWQHAYNQEIYFFSKKKITFHQPTPVFFFCFPHYKEYVFSKKKNYPLPQCPHPLPPIYPLNNFRFPKTKKNMFFKNKIKFTLYHNSPPPSTNLPLSYFFYFFKNKFLLCKKKILPPPTFHQPTHKFFCFSQTKKNFFSIKSKN